MDDQRAIVGREHPNLDQADGPVGTEEQGDIVVIGIGGDGDEVAQSMTDISSAMPWRCALAAIGASHSCTVSVYPDGSQRCPLSAILAAWLANPPRKPNLGF